MSIIRFHFTDKSPSVLFGGTAVLFSTLIIQQGTLDDIEFELTWKEEDEQKRIQSHSVPFKPEGFIDTNTPLNEIVYTFRKVSYPPLYDMQNNISGVGLTEHSLENKPFDLFVDLTIHNYSEKKSRGE